VWLLEWALRSAPAVELLVCGQGLEGSAPTRRDWASPAELLVWQKFDGGAAAARRPPDSLRHCGVVTYEAPQ